MVAASRGKVVHLPFELSSFVGRRRDLAEIKRCLAKSRLVTLTGMGGIGKTRLAVRVGGQVQRTFPDGVWFVDLTQLRDQGRPTSGLQDPDVLAYVVADTMGFRDQGHGSPVRMLAERLAGRRMLLILDNCEHLVPACGLVTEALLAGCPGLRVLATSREPLEVAGELVYPVAPLPVPDVAERPDLDQLSGYESVALFLARARDAVPDFDLTADNRAAVSELCRCLDGLPLALELAAARVRVLAPAQIVERLNDRFRLLDRGSRNDVDRHRTLRACLDWSFHLCSKPEQLLWSRLSVFTGSFDIDAVEGICSSDDLLPERDQIDVLSGLVEKSILIRAEPGGEAARLWMLETIRVYGQKKLMAAGQERELRLRHRDWYGRLVARARSEWVGDRQEYWLARLGREHPNLRAAVEFSLGEPASAEEALRIATTIPLHYWWTHGQYGEVRRWLDNALAAETRASPMRARALLINSQFAYAEGDTAAGDRFRREGEDLAARIGAHVEVAHAANIRGLGALFGGDLPAAVSALSQALTLLSAAQEPDPDLDMRMNLLVALGVAAGLAGDAEWAQVALREMRAVVESRSVSFYRALTHWVAAIVAWGRGDVDEAAEQAMENLRLARAWASEHRANVAMGLEVLAWITAGQGHYRRSAVLLGGADACFAATGASISAQRQFAPHHDACEARLRAALGDAAFAAVSDQGKALTVDAIVAYAVEPSPADTMPPTARAASDGTPPPDPLAPLSAREREVAHLIAQGLGNKAIAAKLVISRRTAEGHVARVLTKLGCNSRAQVAALMAARPSQDG